MSQSAGVSLIEELLADPGEFHQRGRGYDLLQAYFAGLPKDTLRPLLGSPVVQIQRTAAFVASELGRAACDLVDDVLPLVRSGDRYIQYHALEVVAVCCTAERADGFASVLEMLDSEDQVLRVLAMQLASNADVSQLEAARRRFQVRSHRAHDLALSILIAGSAAGSADVAAMIEDSAPLTRRYGAIAAKRLAQALPQLVEAVKTSDDEDLRIFGQRAMR